MVDATNLYFKQKKLQLCFSSWKDSIMLLKGNYSPSKSPIVNLNPNAIFFTVFHGNITAAYTSVPAVESQM